MSLYTDVNGLANFWNKDHTRLEWAKWVYHNPDAVKELADAFLQAIEYNNNLAEIERNVTKNTNTNAQQSRDIESITRVLSLITSPTTLSNEDIDNITGVNLNE